MYKTEDYKYLIYLRGDKIVWEKNKKKVPFYLRFDFDKVSFDIPYSTSNPWFFVKQFIKGGVVMALKYDVVIKTTGMGSGEQELIDNLMKGFIHVLSQKEHLPQHIVFYGEGVKLTTKGSESLEDLLELEKRGVKILSCGICLDYYDLDDYLKVGGTTTMSEVIDIMTNSDLVVEP